jgi:putative membrane protein
MKKTVLSLMALTMVAACGGNDADQTEANTATMDTAATAAPAATAPAATPAVTDPQIADIVVAANQVDIEAGQLATSKATNPQVKEFANRMITDHTGVNKAAGDLVGRLGVTPEENPTSQQLRQGGQQTRTTLQGMSGAAFDSAYIANEVTYHQAVLDALDNTLIPNAQNAELKALLQQTRPAFVAHLEHAQKIQRSLGKS